MGIRSIIFRGKRIDNGEWVEGFYLYTNENTQPVIIDIECCSNVIIPETIGQYTGLVDKNGVKIFEGDIIWLNRRYYKVIYDTLFYAGFCARDLDGDIVSLSRICVEYDVVGNIYQKFFQEYSDFYKSEMNCQLGVIK